MVRLHVQRLRSGGVFLAILGMAGALRCVADDWPQWRGPNRDGVWRESGLLEKFPAPRLKLSWRAEISSGYSGPTVAGGRVLVSDRLRNPESVERVLAFDAATGKGLWTFAYPCRYSGVGYEAGPRAAVTQDEGRAYALGTQGHLHCLDSATGGVLWKKEPQQDYDVRVPQWGIASAPLVFGDLLIVQLGAANGACLVALDKRSGAERWRALDDPTSYSAPIIITQAGQQVLVAWTGDHVAGLDPATGKVFWQYAFQPARMVINVPTPVVEQNRIFVSAFYDGAAMLQLDEKELKIQELWRRRGRSERDTDALHCMISTPVFAAGYVYGVDSYGQFRCLDGRTGDRIWEDLTAVPTARWANIHLVRNQDRYWMFNERGELLIASLSPQGFREHSRAKLIEPTTEQLSQRGGVCWSHPAFANRHIFARNDRELVCASLAR